MAKKINTKAVAKETLAGVVTGVLQELGYDVLDGAGEYGFKGNSLVIKGLTEAGHDVRIDFTTPKAGQDTYDYAKEKFEADLAEAEAELEAAKADK